MDPRLESLRASFHGIVSADGAVSRARFVIDPAAGELLLETEARALRAGEVVLFVPDEAPDAAQLLLELRRADPARDPACLRFRAYHGRASDEGPTFARARVESARIAGEVLGSIDLHARLARDEAAIIRAVNAAGPRLEGRRVVGADESGLDLAGRLGPTRLRFPREAVDADDAVRLAIGALA